MIIDKTGWYAEKEDGGLEFIGDKKEALMEFLEKEGCLDELVKEFAISNYYIEDFIDAVLNEGAYVTKQDILDDYINYEITEGKSFCDGWNWYEWYEQGEVLEETE